MLKVKTTIDFVSYGFEHVIYHVGQMDQYGRWMKEPLIKKTRNAGRLANILKAKGFRFVSPHRMEK